MARPLSRVIKFQRKDFCEEYSTWGKITFLSTVLAVAELTPWIVSLAFVGRVSSLQFAALSLVEVWVYSFLEVAWVAVTQAGSVLISQADGAGSEGAKLGWFAISMTVMTLASAVVALASVCSAFALDQFTDDRELVDAGSYYASWITPAIFFSGYQQMIATYLIATGHAEYPTLCAFIFAFIDIGLTYVFMFGGFYIKPYDNALLANAMSWNVSSLLGLALISLFFFKAVAEDDVTDTNEEVNERRREDPTEDNDEDIALIAIDTAYDEEVAGNGLTHVTVVESSSPRKTLNQTMRVSSASNMNVEKFRHRGSIGSIELAELGDVNLDERPIIDWLRSKKAWHAFGAMLLPFVLTVGSEMMIFFALAFLAAKLGRAQIAAHNTCSAILEYTFSIIIGMAEATSVRIGFFVGKGELTGCMNVLWISICSSLCIGVIVAILSSYYSREIAEIFTDDEDIVQYILQVSPLLWASFAIFAVGDQMLAILEGQGRGVVQMLSSFCGLWLVALPLAFWSFYFEDGGLKDLWWALLIGYIVNELTATLAVYYSDWESIFERAKDHIVLE